jgi:hypothetical protein
VQLDLEAMKFPENRPLYDLKDDVPYMWQPRFPAFQQLVENVAANPELLKQVRVFPCTRAR